MISSRSIIAGSLTAAILGFASPSAAPAQEPAKPAREPAKPATEESLEKILEKLEAKEKADKEKAEKEKADPAKAKDKDKKPGEVASKDQELEKLLEGIGQTKDMPAPDDKKPGGTAGEGPTPPKGDQPRPESLKGDEKAIDDVLRGIGGKVDKPKDQGGKKRKSEEETGPLGQVIKEMRDVEERLGKPDTGEQTRKMQTDIVKNLDGLIEKMKNAPSQQMAMKMIREGNGNKPGPAPKPGQPGSQAGAMNQNGTPPTKPADPQKGRLSLAEANAAWGNLPAQFREEIGNVMNERALPSKEDLIRLYYLSLGKNNSNKED